MLKVKSHHISLLVFQIFNQLNRHEIKQGAVSYKLVKYGEVEGYQNAMIVSKIASY